MNKIGYLIVKNGLALGVQCHKPCWVTYQMAIKFADHRSAEDFARVLGWGSLGAFKIEDHQWPDGIDAMPHTPVEQFAKDIADE